MKKILIPCDFSDTAESALNYAVALAAQFSADLALLHVDMVPVLSPEMSLTAYSFEDIKQDSLNALQNLAGKIRLMHNFNNNIDYFSEMGTPVEVINSHATKLGADLVVMGIAGHGSSFMKNLVGSTSVEVSKRLAVPLIIVPPDFIYKKIGHIMYACDYNESPARNESLERVKYFAGIFNAGLSLVHVVPKDHELSPEENAVDAYIEKSLAEATHRTFIIHENNAAQGLLSFINNNKVDLAMLERKEHSLLHNIFSSSTTNQVAFQSPVPLLTIHIESK